MNTEELYKLKASVKKELKPIVDELITLRELRARLEMELQFTRKETIQLQETIDLLSKTIDIISRRS